MRTTGQDRKGLRPGASTRDPVPARPRPGASRSPHAAPGAARTEVARPEHNLARIPISSGGRRMVERVPFAHVVSRAPEDPASRDEPEPGEEIPRAEGDEIYGVEDEPSSRDTISSTITLVPAVSRGGAGPGATDFGITRSSAALSSIVVTPGTGSFTVAGNLDLTITWEVRSGAGPAGQRDIASERDGDISHTNYPIVISDLTPDLSSDRGRPPRTMFWAQDLTERHEIFHTTQRSGPFGAARVAAIKAFLDGRTATTKAQIRTTLLPMALTEGQRVFNAMVSAPTTEGDAYADGAPLYQARADAIQRRGDLGLYQLGDFPVPDPDAPRFA